MSGRSEVLRHAMRERLRPLRAAERELLMRAAAIGREFDEVLLREMTPASQRPIRAALRAAMRLQLVEPVAGAPGRFRFRHALTHDAVYGELVAAQLRPLHREIGSAIERLASGRATELEELAYHWWAAGDAERGVRYNEEAGDRAGALHAVEHALLYYARALQLAPDGDASRLRLEEKIAAAQQPRAPM